MTVQELIAELVTVMLEHGPELRVEVRNRAGDLDDAKSVWVGTPHQVTGRTKYAAIEVFEPE